MWLIGGVVALIVAGGPVRHSVGSTHALPPEKQPAGGWINAFTIASPGSEHQKF